VMKFVGTMKTVQKNQSQNNRDKGASRIYDLTPATMLPGMDVVLSVSQKKKQLNDFVIGNIFAKIDSINGKFVTGSDPLPVEINGAVSRRVDLSLMHDERDIILIHHIVAAKPNRPYLYVTTLMCL